MEGDSPVSLLGVRSLDTVQPLASLLGECRSVFEQSDVLGRYRAAYVEAGSAGPRDNVDSAANFMMHVLQRGVDRPLKRAALACLSVLKSADTSKFDTAVASWISTHLADVPLEKSQSISLISTLLEEQTLRSTFALVKSSVVSQIVSWFVQGAQKSPDTLRATSRLVPLLLQSVGFMDACKMSAELRVRLNQLLDTYIDILPRPGIARDTVTLISMALVTAARTLFLVGCDDVDKDALVSLQQRFILCTLGTDLEVAADNRVVVGRLGPAWTASLSLVARLALLRAFCVAYSPAVLGLPIPTKEPPCAEAPQPCILTHCLAPIIFKSCRDPDPDLRLYGVQSLESWLVVLRRTQKWLRAPEHCIVSNVIINARLLSDTLRLILSNWEHSSRRITGVVPHLFDLLLDIQEDEASSSSAGAASVEVPPPTSAAATLATELLAQTHGSGARYSALARLLPRVGARSFFAARPSLVPDLLAASGSAEAPSPAPCDLLVRILVEHRKEIETSRALLGSHDGGSSEGWRRGMRQAAPNSPALITPLTVIIDAKGKRSRPKRSAKPTPADESACDTEKALPLLRARLSSRGLECFLALDRPIHASDLRLAPCNAAGDFVKLFSSPCLSVLEASDPERGRRCVAAADALAAEIDDDGSGASWVSWAAGELLYADACRRWMEAWMPHVTACLLDPRRLLRSRTVAYGLPALLRMDPSISPALLVANLQEGAAPVRPDHGDDLYSWYERRIAAVLSVARICRSFTTAADSVIAPVSPSPSTGVVAVQQSQPLVAIELLDAALDFPDPELRLLALEVAAVTFSTTSLPSAAEYALVLRYIRLNIKAVSPDTQYRAGRLLVAFLTRITAGLAAMRKRRAEGEAKVSITLFCVLLSLGIFSLLLSDWHTP